MYDQNQLLTGTLKVTQLLLEKGTKNPTLHEAITAGLSTSIPKKYLTPSLLYLPDNKGNTTFHLLTLGKTLHIIPKETWQLTTNTLPKDQQWSTPFDYGFESNTLHQIPKHIFLKFEAESKELFLTLTKKSKEEFQRFPLDCIQPDWLYGETSNTNIIIDLLFAGHLETLPLRLHKKHPKGISTLQRTLKNNKDMGNPEKTKLERIIRLLEKPPEAQPEIKI